MRRRRPAQGGTPGGERARRQPRQAAGRRVHARSPTAPMPVHAGVCGGVQTPPLAAFPTGRLLTRCVLSARPSSPSPTQAGVVAFKLYPAGATTNSDSGVTDWRKCLPTLRAMAEVRPRRPA